MRTDYYTEDGFDVKQPSLEQAGKWRLLERGEPFQPMPNPESTEGGRRVSVLKRQEGAPVNLG